MLFLLQSPAPFLFLLLLLLLLSLVVPARGGGAGGIAGSEQPRPSPAIGALPPRNLVGSVCYTANLYDEYGDGWDGAVLSFTNVATGAAASEEGLTLEEFIDTETEKAVEVCFDCGCYFGQATEVQYSKENSWSLFDLAGSTTLASAEGADESVTFCTASASCPSYPSSCSEGSGLSSDYTSCEACPPGRFKSNDGSATCEACAPGTHFAGTGATVCVKCGTGTYSSAGAASCGDCEAGMYGDEDTNRCEACATGRYNSHTGAKGAGACSECEEGKYNMYEGSSDASVCAVCAEGYSSTPGSAYCYSAIERNALVALYQSAGGKASWSDYGCGNNWLVGDHCTWDGVICNDSGDIERLSLSQCGLTGTLPEEIGNLQNIITLDLSDNFLTGIIPAEIGNLQNVEYVYLQNNKLVGPLPREVGKLQAVKVLILSENELVGQLPSELGLLQMIEVLYLHNNKFSGPIPPQIGNLQQTLVTLLLSFNQLEGPIPKELGQLRSLQHLGLASNQLEGPIPSQLGELPVLGTLDLSNNRLTGPVPSNLQEKCFSLSFGSFVGALCLLYGNDLTCPRGTSLLLSGCMFCPFPERCPGGTKWGEYCSSGFERSDCSVCPVGSYILGDSCLRCASGWANGFESLVYLLIAISVVLVLSLLLVKLRVFDPRELFRRLQFDINTIVCMKQLGGLFQILALVCSVVVTPDWYGKLSNVLRAASLPLQVNSPCAPGLQSQPKYVQGIATILLVTVVTALMAVAPFLPFVRSKVEASTAAKIQRLAGVVVGQSAICISATLEQISKTPFKQKENKSDGFVLIALDDREMFNLNDVIAQVTITVVFIWGLSTLYSLAVAKFEESRHASTNGQKSTNGQISASMLPFYSTFCMPYTPSMSDFDLTVLARKVVAFLLSILFGSLKYYFTLLRPQKNCAVTVACAGMQSSLFVWLNVWYIRRLVKRPYISGRRSHTIGDPLNDTDMLTTRVYIWSSAMLALSSVLNGQEEGNLSRSRATITNVLCGIIVIALVWPQRLLFLGLRQSLRELWARERIDGQTAAAAAKGEVSSVLVEKMTKAMDASALFSLQKELLQRGDLSAVERSRWTAKMTTHEEESDASASGFLRCGVWTTCRVQSRKLKKHRAGRVFLRVFQLLVGAVVILATVGVAYAILQYGVVKRVNAGVEYACVCAATLSAVASEVLRVRWTRAYVKTALEKHSSNIFDTTEGDVGNRGSIRRTADDQKSVELVEVMVGSVGTGNEDGMTEEPKEGEREDEGRVTMVRNPMPRKTG